jgi:hypothetical protein
MSSLQMETEGGTDRLMIRTDLKASLNTTALQRPPSRANEHMINLLSSDAIIAIPTPAIDVLTSKPSTSNSQAVIPTKANKPIRVVIGHAIAKGTDALVFGDTISTRYRIEVGKADTDITAVDSLEDLIQITIEGVLICRRAVLNGSICDHYGKKAASVRKAGHEKTVTDGLPAE